MRPVLTLFCLLFFSIGLFAQKKPKETIESMTIQNDSLKRSLAEARREWQKCKEKSSSSDIALRDSLVTERTKNINLEQKLSQAESKANKTSDSLRKTKEAYSLLQKSFSTKETQLTTLENSARALATELADSLAPWLSPNLYTYHNKKQAFIMLSDSSLFAGSYYVNKSGRKLLEKIAEVLQKHGERNIIVCTYSDEGTKTQDLWKSSSQKALAIVSIFETLKLPAEKMLIKAQGSSREVKNYKKPPIVIELSLE